MPKQTPLPDLTPEQVQALVKHLRDNADFDDLCWDDFCCASDSVDGGFELAIKTLEKAYGCYVSDEDDEDEESEDEE